MLEQSGNEIIFEKVLLNNTELISAKTKNIGDMQE